MEYNFTGWWCCLNPRESGMLSDIVHSSILVPLYMLEIEYQLLWSLRGYGLDNLIVQNFEATYYITHSTIEIPEVGEVEVVLLGTDFWLNFKAFSLTDAFVCSMPCDMLRFPL
jgi:hypothetical protein